MNFQFKRCQARSRFHNAWRSLAVAAGFAAALASAMTARADAPRVLPPGKLPADARLEKPKDYDGYFPFTPSKTPDEWAKRAERVRRQILVATGLWPMPTKTPLNPVIHGKVQRDGYTVERVYFESYPGLFVTGSLYRPTGKTGKLPAVLNPHGHWNNGRFNDAGEAATQKEIAAGAEKFPVGGRYPLQAKCVQLARMGCVVLLYDMMGNADSQQLPAELIHRYSKQRPEMDTAENWGFYSTQAELRQQSVMGLQTYNSIRALDFLTGLPDVDPARIGVTGASGGGTQTFILSAIDPRVAVSMPAVMVSTAMQGGCTCENCSLLRVDTGNIEFAAMFAPKPLGLTVANDWTKDMPTKGLPELKQHYAMMGQPDKIMASIHTEFGHNYNAVSRAAMYQWFNKHLKIGLPEPVVEQDYQPLSKDEMTVWDDKHPIPPGGDDFERSLLKWITTDSDKNLAALTPSDAKSLANYRQVVGGAVDVLIGRGVPAAGAIEHQQVGEKDRGEYVEFTALLKNKAAGEEIPVVFLHPKKWNRKVVIWVHEAGKNGLFASDASPTPEVRKLLAAGTAVAGADLLFQGEFLADGKPVTKTRKVENPREFAGFTFGYNSALFAQRTDDVLTLVSFCRNYKNEKPEQVSLLGLGAAGPWVAAAAAQAGSAVDRSAVDTGGFRFARLTSFFDVGFLPGAVKYGDLPGILALAAPQPLWLSGEGKETPAVVSAAYKAAGQADKLTSFSGPEQQKTAAAIDWLLK